ncbi:MAG: hypothetical protein E7600_03775 [Ruminococcaceae bacterium]|nr:hypothetical protein [Oscillospiraceae bacterium]
MKKENAKRRKFFFKDPLIEQIKKHKATFAVYLILRLIVVVVLILSVIGKRYENVFVCSLTLVLFLVPAFFQKNFGIQLPTTLEIIIMLFIFAAEILGEIGAYYVKVPLWDTMLHTTNGFLCAAVGFSLVDLLNRNNRFKFHLSPLYLSIVAFCFSMTIGVLWEMFEFGADVFLGTDMQKDYIITKISSVALNAEPVNKAVVIDGISEVTVNGQLLNVEGYLDIGLIDTMKDLIVNFVGAVVFSIIGFFYVKSRGKLGFARRFIPTLAEKEPDIEDDDTQTNVK